MSAAPEKSGASTSGSSVAPSSSSSSSSSAAPLSRLPRDTMPVDGEDEDTEYLGADEAAQVIEVDDDDDQPPPEDDEVELTDEEKKQIEKAQTVEKDLRAMLDADDSVQGFFDHTDSVFAVGLNPADPSMAVSGGCDDRSFVWKITDGSKKFELSGHTDSVVGVGFSYDGKYVASASMDATIRIYTTADGKLKHVLEGPSKEIEWMAWHPAGPVIAAGSADETVWMWNAETADCMAAFSGHSGSATCGAWSADGKSLLSCDDGGDLICWNPKTGEPAQHMRGLHDAPITSFATHPDKSQKLCVTGAADGSVKVVNYENGRTIATFKDAHADSVEGVQFAPKLKLVASCSVDGKVKVWDLTNGSCRVTCSHDDAVTHIEWAPNGDPFIFASSVDKTIRLWDARSGQCEKTWKGHSDTALTFAVTPDAGTIVTASDDHTALVFKR